MIKNETQELERDIKTGERWLIGISAGIFLLQIVIALIYWGQLNQMRVATEANTKAVQLAEDTLDLNQGEFDRTMRQMIYQTSAAQGAALDAKQQAGIAAADTLRKSQRPWVNAETFEGVPTGSEGPATGIPPTETSTPSDLA